MTTFKKGDIVFYSPIMIPGQPKFAGVVRADPWQLGSGDWVTHLTGLPNGYGDFVNIPGKDFVHAACFEALELAPTFFCKERRLWQTPSPNEDESIDAEIFYVMSGTAGAISFPLGVGWAYRAGTHFDRAESYNAARAAVEEIYK